MACCSIGCSVGFLVGTLAARLVDCSLRCTRTSLDLFTVCVLLRNSLLLEAVTKKRPNPAKDLAFIEPVRRVLFREVEVSTRVAAVDFEVPAAFMHTDISNSQSFFCPRSSLDSLELQGIVLQREQGSGERGESSTEISGRCRLSALPAVGSTYAELLMVALPQKRLEEDLC